MTQPIAQFHEEVSAKLPALTLLTNLGYQFISPQQALEMRDSLSSVVLEDVLREVLQKKSTLMMRCGELRSQEPSTRASRTLFQRG